MRYIKLFEEHAKMSGDRLRDDLDAFARYGKWDDVALLYSDFVKTYHKNDKSKLGLSPEKMREALTDFIEKATDQQIKDMAETADEIGDNVEMQESQDPDAMLKTLVAEFKKNGITPKEENEWKQESDAGCDIDGMYSIQIAEYTDKPFHLSMWVDKDGKPSDGYKDGGGMQDVIQKKTAPEIVAEYIKEKNKKKK